MKLTVDKERLQKALGLVGRAVSRRATMPILANIKMSATSEDNLLCLEATDRETVIKVWIAADVEEDGETTAPAELMTSFIAGVPSGKADMSITKNNLLIKVGKYEAKLRTMDAFEYPLSAPVEGGWTAEIPMDGLREAMAKVTIAASNDENRPSLTGVQMSFSEEKLRLAATDGYRMSYAKIELDESVKSALSMIVPHQALEDFGKFLSEGNPHFPIEMWATTDRIALAIEGKGAEKIGGINRLEMQITLIDGKYPDWTSTVPKDYLTRITVDTQDFLRSLKVALLIAKNNNNMVILTTKQDVAGGTLSIAAAAADWGDTVSSVDAKVEGSGLAISFNAVYLIESLTQVADKEIVIDFTQPTRPGMAYPLGKGRDDSFFVWMPMHPPR